MYNKVTYEDIKYLKEAVGDEYVLIGEEINSDYGHDELGGVEKMPEVLVRVNSTEEVSAVMKRACARNIPVTVRDGEGKETVLKIELRVWNFELGYEFATAFGLDEEHLLPRFHGQHI